MLQLFYLVGGNESSFIVNGSQLEIGAYTYSATRMGSAPIISATLNYPICLDNLWEDNVYVKYKDERYFLKQIPSSSYSNESVMYKHEIEFVSERVALENVYFYDVVDADFDDDKPVSNNSEFSFSGDIHQFAARLNQSLRYAGLDYSVVVDEGIESEDKLITVENKFFSAVLQEAYNTYEIPYYFIGKVIHIGFSGNVINEVFEYGVNNALMSVTKTNADNRIINRVTGMGSEDNIPYYYPNLSPKGDIEAKAATGNSVIKDADITITDYEAYAEKVDLNGVITAYGGYSYITGRYVDFGKGKQEYTSGTTFDIYKGVDPYNATPVRAFFQINSIAAHANILINPTLNVQINGVSSPVNTISYIYIIYDGQNENDKVFLNRVDDGWELYDLPVGVHEICVEFQVSYYGASEYYKCSISDGYQNKVAWYYNGERLKTYTIGNDTYIDGYGLKISKNAVANNSIIQKFKRYVQPQTSLMPPIYSQSAGVERFYNATNDTYQNPEENEGVCYDFENPFVEGRPKEIIVKFDEIKPTIKGVYNSTGARIDMFSEFAYDQNDNDETYEDENGNLNYEHPYFFGKLRKLDFNLFDCVSEKGEMTISMTSGTCGACEFIVGVDAETKKNPVQVNSKGQLVYDSNGNVLCGREDFQSPTEPQPKQQDTINNEVWIALKKDTKTYGVLMPNVTSSYRPNSCKSSSSNDGDTFVILNINLPQSYIKNAEKELEEQLIRFMYDNNFEKFKFAIKFSRIYLAEHETTTAKMLSENSRITIRYNNQDYPLYVSSYTYKVDENALPEVTVELTDEISVSQNYVQRTVNNAVGEVYKTIGNIDVVAQANNHFLRKDMPDTAEQQITFNKTAILKDGATIKGGGLKSDDYYADLKGLAIYKDENENWHIESDYLNARKKFTAKEVEIQKVRHISGAQIKSSAAMICSRVEDAGDSYRCYMNTTDADGNTIYNEFIVGDQAYVQTFNLVTDEYGNNTNHYYWRKVIGVGNDYILLSKLVCAEGSTKPMVGDNIVQLGCQDNDYPERQVAVIDAGAGTGAPYYRQFVGINSFVLPEPETQLKPNDNILTGRIVAKAGSVLPVATRNLLSNSKSVAVSDFENQGYVFKTMPLAQTLVLNTGDKLTFNTEEIKIPVGYAEEAEISLFTYNPITKEPIKRISEPAYISENNRTATLTVDLSLAPRSIGVIELTANYALLLYAGKWGETQGNRVEYTKCSLVQGEYPLAVWSDSPEDQVTTTIDNGIITSGTIQLGDSTTIAKAGITGAGDSDDSIRIWAGSGESTKNDAPFRVLQDGTMYAYRGAFGGLLSRSKLVLTDDNISDYTTTEYGRTCVDLVKTGRYIECQSPDALFWLKGLSSMSTSEYYDDPDYIDECRSLVGNVITLYNNSGSSIMITGQTASGRLVVNSDNTITMQYYPSSLSISDGHVAKIECKLVKFDGMENIIWVTESMDMFSL